MCVCVEGGVCEGEHCMWRVCVPEKGFMPDVHALHIM